MKHVRVLKIEGNQRREMTFNEYDWTNIVNFYNRQDNPKVRWELLPDPIEIEDTHDINLIDVFDKAVELDIIEQRGSWYYFGEQNLGQGAKARDLSKKTKELIYESISSR